MDCKTARLLLELPAPATTASWTRRKPRALEDHLAGCDDCGPLSHGERRADEVLGRAMRQVDVPDQLRGRILARLEDRRGDRRRVWRRYGVRASAAAAALLLLVLGLWHWYAIRPAFPAVQLLTDANNIGISPPDQEQVDATLKGQGFENAAPDYNYNHLSWLFLANVEGRPTPLLLFNDRGRPSPGAGLRLPRDTSSISTRCRPIPTPRPATCTNTSVPSTAATTTPTSFTTRATTRIGCSRCASRRRRRTGTEVERGMSCSVATAPPPAG